VSEHETTNRITTKEKLEKIQFDFLIADIERENQSLAKKIAKFDLLIKK
jgi:hypothetical protein